MALRLQGGGYSYDGTAWDVYLYGPGNGVINAHLGEDIVTIRYDGNDLGINAAIIPSSASIVIKAKNQSEIDANEALLTEIALAGEGEFILKIYRNSALHWVGLVLADQIQFSDDRLPRPLTIRAVDGLARLKDVEFNKDGNEFSSLAYLSQHIIIALQKTGLWAELSPGLRVSTGWTNAQVSGYASFLEGIRLDHVVWLYIDTKGATATTTNKRSKTAWQVLEEFARLFHARVFMSGGSFWFVQISQYLTAATATIHNFGDNGSVSGTASGLPIAYSNVYTQAIGASWEYQPATKRVKVTYRHSSAKNINIEINFLTGPVVIKAIESFSGTAKLYLSFLLAYPTQLPVSYPTYLSHVHKFKVTIRVGDYWLKQTAQVVLGQIIYTSPVWVTTAADYEFFVYPNFGPNGQNRYNFNLVSPPLPANGDATISLTYVLTHFIGSGTSPTITPFEWSVTNANFQVLPVGLVEEAFNETVYTQESNLTATKQVEITSTFGDGPYSHTLTTMKARRPEGTTPPITQTWTGSGATGTIHQVLAASIIKFSGKVAKKINLPFIGSDYAPQGLVEYETAFYILLSGDFVARSNTWNGVFIQVADQGNGITLPPIKYISKKPSLSDVIQSPETGFPGTIPDDGRLDLPEVKKADLTALRAGTIPTTTDEPIEAGVVTSIPVNPFELDRVLLAGDKIVITDVYTGKPTVFTVATTTAAGASSISVVSQTITDRIVDGSYIQLDPEYLYTRSLTNLANIGTGAQVFKDKVNQVANLRTILAGTGITVSQNANDITISSSASGGMTSFNINGDAGTLNAITNGETMLVIGGGGLRTVASTNQIQVFLNFFDGLIAATPVSGDVLAMWDVSGNTHAKITIQDIINLVPAGFTSFTIAAGSGTANSITNGETLTIAQGTAIDTVAGTNQVSVSFNLMKLAVTTTPSTDDFLVLYDNTLGQHQRVTVANLLALAASSFTSFNIGGDTGTANAITNGETLTVSGGVGLSSQAITNGVVVNLDINGLSTVSPDGTDKIPIYDSSSGGHFAVTVNSILSFVPSYNIGGFILSTDASGRVTVTTATPINSGSVVVCYNRAPGVVPGVVNLISSVGSTLVTEFRDFDGNLLVSTVVGCNYIYLQA